MSPGGHFLPEPKYPLYSEGYAHRSVGRAPIPMGIDSARRHSVGRLGPFNSQGRFGTINIEGWRDSRSALGEESFSPHLFTLRKSIM